MYLDNIKKTNDIKNINPSYLPLVARDIRERIIDVVSGKGGHLASNLGAVEITLALHYLMDMERDKLIFDVGHQAYTHKLLTGRADKFDSLRSKDGLSGFPNPSESPADLFCEGHASCGISEGVGLVRAREVSGEDYRVAVVAGDGSLTGGLSFEALNNAAELKSNLTIILNDNKMSISKNVGGISRNLSAIRTSIRYSDLKDDVTRSLERIPGIGEPLIKTISKTKRGIKQLLIPGMFFEDMDIMYLGPVDGHDINALIEMIGQAFRYKGTCVVHAITQKGKGYTPALQNPSGFHGTGPFERRSGKRRKKEKPDYTDVFASSIVRLGRSNDRICAVTAAMTEGTGLKRFEKEFPQRFFDVGIAESHGVVFASALAKKGFVPFVAIYSTFLQRAYDQILMNVCLNGQHVVFAVDRAGIVGQDGATHQGVFDITYLTMMPGMTVMAPKNKNELAAMLKFAAGCEGPVAIRYPRGESFEGLSEHRAAIRLGKCEPITEGGDILLFALGSMVSVADECASILGESGIKASVTNARFAKPLDREYLNSVRGYKMIVTLEENVVTGGFGMQTQSLLDELGFAGKVLKIAVPDQFIPHGSVDEIKREIGLDAQSIAHRIKEVLS